MAVIDIWDGRLDEDATRATEVVPAPQPLATTTSYQELTETVGHIRNVVRLIDIDTANLHRDVGSKRLNERAHEFSHLTTRELLDGLNELGFTWRDIARMTGVSVPAIQKWRKGETASGENHKRLMILRALMVIISAELLDADVTTWADIPIVPGAPITAIDLIASRREDLALELAFRHASPEEIVNEFEPGWREKYRSDYVVERSSDGLLSIVPVRG